MSWSSGKQDWCCRHSNRGCSAGDGAAADRPGAGSGSATNAGCDTDCKVGAMVATCKARIQWAAKHHHGGEDSPCVKAIEEVIGSCEQCAACPLADAGCAEPDYACGDGNEAQWSAQKRGWCCEHASKACSTTLSEAPAPAADGYDCAEDEDWEVAWSLAKKDWCCENKHRGCTPSSSFGTASAPDPPATAAASEAASGRPFNCAMGFSTWSWGWSLSKKAFCCAHVGKGCSKDEAGAPPPPPPLGR